MNNTAYETWVAKARRFHIEDVLSQRGIPLKHQGKTERVGPCPKCGGDDRFAINISKKVFNCRGCGAGGDVIELVKFLDGVDFKVACETLTHEPPPKAVRLNGKDHKVITAKYDYVDENGALLFQVIRFEPKAFRQRKPDGNGSWTWGLGDVRRVLFKLPDLIEAVAAGRLVFVVEGERDVLSLNKIGMVATTNAGGAGKWRPEYSEYLRGADIIIIPDSDDVGHKHIQDVGAALQGIAKRTRVLMLPAKDVTEWLADGHTREELDTLAEAAPEWAPPLSSPVDETKKKEAAAKEQQIVDELASLNRLDYDRRRRDAARDMGIRSGSLDDAVEARRAENAAAAGPPPLFGHWVVEPWPEPVDGDALLLQIIRRLQSHVLVTNEQAVAVTLWILMAWTHAEVAVHSPILLATSAEPNSGKTTLLNMISFLTPSALLCVGISEAALFRGIELWEPTIIVDEADVILIDNEPLRSVINTGHTRGGAVPRCIGDDKVPHAFPTFCPKAIGMKGRKLPDTTLSRCIVIEMKRKKPRESVRHFRVVDDDGLRQLREQARRWADDNGEALKGAEPVMPAGFDNRLSDNWRLMLAVADRAGGEWPEVARQAAQRLADAADVASIGTRLLAAIKAVFADDVMASNDLVGKLTAEEDAPWSEWKSGKPITQAQLARALKPFGIAPQQVRLKTGKQVRGYLRAWFEDAWERYLTG